MLQDFIGGLQFLTTIRLTRNMIWSPIVCGRSVRYFPLVGAVIGVLLVGIDILISSYLPPAIKAAVLLITATVLTGGLHSDGLMDTADGLLAGGSRQRMLDIMKDSRVGSFGIITYVSVILLKWSLLFELLGDERLAALIVMPVLGRFAMTLGITLFPYARPDGIGKAFAQYAGRPALFMAALWTVLITAGCGLTAWAALAATTVFALLLACYASDRLGGLTGDVYGAITELTETLVLLTYVVAARVG